jgi:hypothetical protein
VVAPTAHITNLKGNARTFVKKKKPTNFDAFLVLVGQVDRSTLRVQIFLPEFFVLLDHITVTFFILFFV